MENHFVVNVTNELVLRPNNSFITSFVVPILELTGLSDNNKNEMQIQYGGSVL